MLETSNFVYGLARITWIISTRVVHGSILCDLIQPDPSADWPNPTQPSPWTTLIVDLENFATVSIQCIGAINELIDGQLVDYTYYGRARHGRMHKFITRWSTVNLTSCSYTDVQQLAKFWLTHRVARRSSRASCRDITHYLSNVADFNPPHLHLAPVGVDPGRISRRSLAWAIVWFCLAALVEHRLVTYRHRQTSTGP